MSPKAALTAVTLSVAGSLLSSTAAAAEPAKIPDCSKDFKFAGVVPEDEWGVAELMHNQSQTPFAVMIVLDADGKPKLDANGAADLPGYTRKEMENSACPEKFSEAIDTLKLEYGQ